MKTALVSILASLAVLATGCGSDGRAVAVDFGDGSATVTIRGVTVANPAGQPTELGAQMVSDLPGVYEFTAAITSPSVFKIQLANEDQTSHAIDLRADGLEVRFEHGAVNRTESMQFPDTDAFDRWLQARVADGRADCNELPARYSDMPLHVVSEALLSDIASEHQLSVDLPRLRQIMCAQGAQAPGGNGVYGLAGFDGWLALTDPEYVGEDWLAQINEQQRQPQQVAKNTCPTEDIDIQIDAPIDLVETSPTGNLLMTCTETAVDVSAECCVDEPIFETEHGELRSRGIDSFVACDQVVDANGNPTKYAEFRFTSGITACPTGVGTCSPNGSVDNVTPNHCTLSGYQDASPIPFTDIGGPAADQDDGIAGYSLTVFMLYVCYESGATEDTIYFHDRTITDFDARVCNDTNLDECHCG